MVLGELVVASPGQCDVLQTDVIEPQQKGERQRQWPYILHAVVAHLGSASSGHFLAFRRCISFHATLVASMAPNVFAFSRDAWSPVVVSLLLLRPLGHLPGRTSSWSLGFAG